MTNSRFYTYQVKDINHLLMIFYYRTNLIEHLILLSYSLPLQLSCYSLAFTYIELNVIQKALQNPIQNNQSILLHQLFRANDYIFFISLTFTFSFSLLKKKKRRIITNVGQVNPESHNVILHMRAYVTQLRDVHKQHQIQLISSFIKRLVASVGHML